MPRTSEPPPAETAAARSIVRFDGGAVASSEDLVAEEEPLEIRLTGEPLSITLRTPGHDHELCLGFLFAEGLVAEKEDVGAVVHCGRPGDGGYGNVIDVTGAPGRVPLVPERIRRGTISSSACGLCGRERIDDLLARCRTLEDTVRVAPAALSALVRALGAEQPGFTATGGLHAAGLACLPGGLFVVREDIGRHNAVDKVIGRALLDGRLPLSGHVLVVSGRSSFEIVQKAVVARIPIVVSVSAPSTLAVDTAERAGLTLVGFARGEAFNVYTHGERIAE